MSHVRLASILLACGCAPALAGPADPDPRFDGDGRALYEYEPSVNSRSLVIHDVGPRPGGGYVALVERTTASGFRAFIDQLDDRGQLLQSTDAGAHGFFNGAVTADGKVLIASALNSNGTSSLRLQRRLADGTLDAGFSGDGQVVLTEPTGRLTPTTTAVDAQGRIVVGGHYLPTGVNDFAQSSTFLAKLDAAGAPVAAFDGDGLAVVDILPNQGDVPQALARVPSTGAVLVCLVGDFGGQYDAVLARVRSSGPLDTSYASSGLSYVDTTLPGGNNRFDYCDDVEILPGSETALMALHTSSSSARLVRLDADGNAAPSFDHVVGTGITRSQVTVDAQQRALLVVDVGAPGALALDITRFTANGAPDATFGVGGKVQVALPLPGGIDPAQLQANGAHVAEVDPRGRILAGASLGSTAVNDDGWALVRLMGEVMFQDGFE